MLYYGDAVIAAFDETVVRRVWILSDKEPNSEAFYQLAISEEGFWLGRSIVTVKSLSRLFI